MSNNPRPQISNISIRQVTEETKFHIDYGWWEQSTLDLRSYLINRLQTLGMDNIHLDPNAHEVDLVDMHTGEVTRVDGFQYVVQTYFSQLPPDFAQRSSLVDAVFCVLMANANRPLTAQEIAQQLGRSADVVLRTLNGPRIYQGITPVFE